MHVSTLFEAGGLGANVQAWGLKHVHALCRRKPFNTQGRDGYVQLANEYAVEASLSIEECTR